MRRPSSPEWLSSIGRLARACDKKANLYGCSGRAPDVFTVAMATRTPPQRACVRRRYDDRVISDGNTPQQHQPTAVAAAALSGG